MHKVFELRQFSFFFLKSKRVNKFKIDTSLVIRPPKQVEKYILTRKKWSFQYHWRPFHRKTARTKNMFTCLCFLPITSHERRSAQWCESGLSPLKYTDQFWLALFLFPKGTFTQSKPQKVCFHMQPKFHFQCLIGRIHPDLVVREKRNSTLCLAG